MVTGRDTGVSSTSLLVLAGGAVGSYCLYRDRFTHHRKCHQLQGLLD
jgi:hypothetical protein